MQSSCRLQSELREGYRFAPSHDFASHCPPHCSTCVALAVRAMDGLDVGPQLPPPYEGSLTRVLSYAVVLVTRVALVAGLNPTSHDTS